MMETAMVMVGIIRIKGQFGNEDQGISAKMRELTDETFYLPICGFAESFNLSVDTAIMLAYMRVLSHAEVTPSRMKVHLYLG